FLVGRAVRFLCPREICQRPGGQRRCNDACTQNRARPHVLRFHDSTADGLHSTSTAWHFVGGIGYGRHPAVARLSWPLPTDDRCHRRRQRQQRQHEFGVERERQRPGERQRGAEHYLAAEELVVRIEQARQP